MILRPIDEGDLELLRSWRNDTRINRWCRQSLPISSIDQHNWYVAYHKDNSIKMFAIEHDGMLIGCSGLTSIDLVNRRAEFSLYVEPKQQGKGLAREALIELLKIGFNCLGLNRIYGEVFQGNSAIELFKRVGFELEGTRKQFYFKHGVFIDAHIISITKENICYT